MASGAGLTLGLALSVIVIAVGLDLLLVLPDAVRYAAFGLAMLIACFGLVMRRVAAALGSAFADRCRAANRTKDSGYS